MKMSTFLNKWVSFWLQWGLCKGGEHPKYEQTTKEQYTTYFWQANEPLITNGGRHHHIEHIQIVTK